MPFLHTSWTIERVTLTQNGRRYLDPYVLVQAAYRDVQTLVKHNQGLWDRASFEETKASLQQHMDELVEYDISSQDLTCSRLLSAYPYPFLHDRTHTS
jgi:hypothetical protein